MPFNSFTYLLVFFPIVAVVVAMPWPCPRRFATIDATCYHSSPSIAFVAADRTCGGPRRFVTIIAIVAVVVIVVIFMSCECLL